MDPVETPSENARRPELTRLTVRVLAPGHTYASVTDKISSIVLTQKTPRGWWIGFAIAFALFMMLHVAIAYLLMIGRRDLGNQHPGRLGIRHRQFRVVDRNRPRGHADFRHSCC